MSSGWERSSCAPAALAVDVNTSFENATVSLTGPLRKSEPLKSLYHVALSTNCIVISRAFAFGPDLNETFRADPPRYLGFVDVVGPRSTSSAWPIDLIMCISVCTPVPMTFIQKAVKLVGSNSSFRGLNGGNVGGTSSVQIVNLLRPS